MDYNFQMHRRLPLRMKRCTFFKKRFLPEDAENQNKRLAKYFTSACSSCWTLTALVVGVGSFPCRYGRIKLIIDNTKCLKIGEACMALYLLLVLQFDLMSEWCERCDVRAAGDNRILSTGLI